MDYTELAARVFALDMRYSELLVQSIGRSLLGRDLLCLSFGQGERTLLYVGAHHGMEHLTADLLLSFAEELLGAGRETRVGEARAAYLLSTRRFYLVPMLNPDGVMLSVRGRAGDTLLAERLIRMNGGRRDFRRWQANARGVDLNHNYDAGFWEYKRLEGRLGIEGGGPTRYAGEYPESEPETAALARLVRTLAPELILTLHTQGEEIYYTSGGFSLPRQRGVAEAMARLSGYRTAIPEGAAAYGGLTDWAVGVLGIPSYTIECGRGENPLPASALTGMRLALRPLLWSAPLL